MNSFLFDFVELDLASWSQCDAVSFSFFSTANFWLLDKLIICIIYIHYLLLNKYMIREI